MRDITDYTEKYLDEGFEGFQVQYRRKKVLEIIKEYQPKKILEIGCGLLPLFMDYKNARYVIVEPSGRFINNAKEMQIDEDVRFIQGFFEEQAEKLENDFDMIICSSLLHEVKEPKELLKAIKKVCTDKTRVHINVPNANSFHRILARESELIKDVFQKSNRNIDLQQTTIFDQEHLTKMVEESGFEVEELGSYFLKPFSHKQMELLLDNDIIDKKVLDGFYNIVDYMPSMGSEIFVNCRIRRSGE